MPELALKRLDPMAARALLAEHAPHLPAHIRDRVLAEADGNPLALLELPRTEDGDPRHLPLPHRLQDAYQRRIAKLPSPTRNALLVAAAEESGALAAKPSPPSAWPRTSTASWPCTTTSPGRATTSSTSPCGAAPDCRVRSGLTAGHRKSLARQGDEAMTDRPPSEGAARDAGGLAAGRRSPGAAG
ncbi:hypothetical protein [Nonomuraea sp. NPDC050691]|uniref:hypothetical protein n=1 Tax=Nonomuraea sp. NPDC050691 TaxID=3155661 RepID=UPI00340F578C